jgi:hypothetical protein
MIESHADPKSWPPRAYKNLEFLNSPEARKIRVLCEMTEPERRFREENIEDTIVIFGSARTRTPEAAEAALRATEQRVRERPADPVRDEAALLAARSAVRVSQYYNATRDLAKELTLWSKGLKDKRRRFIVCSGGGPGVMEAANRGARDAGGASIGLGISLPFEQSLNSYITNSLKFEFHYFFVRKYWFVYLAKTLVAMPGGFGTLDELFETLTLIQTHKLSKRVPVVLFGVDFWNDIMNFQAMVDWGMISPEDLELFRIFDTVKEARDYIVDFLTREYLV